MRKCLNAIEYETTAIVEVSEGRNENANNSYRIASSPLWA